MKRFRLPAIAVLVALMSMLLLIPVSAFAASSHTSSAHTVCASMAPSKDPFQNIPVTGTVKNRAGHDVGTFTGHLTVQHFAAQHGKLVAQGVLSGKLFNKAGGVIGTLKNDPVTLPVAIPNATCTILDLVLGPLHLDVLGLVIDLNRVHLTITAHRGSLLGDLLCDIAHLLDNGGPLSAIVNDLNQVLNLLK